MCKIATRPPATPWYRHCVAAPNAARLQLQQRRRKKQTSAANPPSQRVGARLWNAPPLLCEHLLHIICPPPTYPLTLVMLPFTRLLPLLLLLTAHLHSLAARFSLTLFISPLCLNESTPPFNPPPHSHQPTNQKEGRTAGMRYGAQEQKMWRRNASRERQEGGGERATHWHS